LRCWLSLLLLAASTSAQGASFDPDMTWRTITTEHFNIHFHQGEEQLAEEFSETVEEVYETMVEEIKWTPRRRTELVLVDRTDSANGYASVVPYNQIVIFTTAPTEDSTLNLYENWNEAIFTHELTHVLHMDANHGIVRAARSVVGKIASTNDLSPWWMVEGYATFQETRHSTGGRGRSSWPDMLKRTAVVDDAFPPLGNLDGLQPNPPSGNLRYLFGQDFIQYVADTRGEDVWTRWVHFYGSGFPYVFDLPKMGNLFPARRAFGKRIVPMYFEWKEHLIAKYTAQAEAVRAEGETVSRLLSGGEETCSAPAFSPDGDKLVWSCYDLHAGSALWISDGEGYAREILLKDRGAGYFTWRKDSEAFVYGSTHIVNRFNTWSDIYMLKLGSEAPVTLTSGKRARDPDFSPDGTQLLYVTNRAQNNQLETMTVDRTSTKLTNNDDHTQYSTPRWSPDGKAVALSVWKEGRRDLWLHDPEGQPIRRITADSAIDADPVWSADGEWLYFSSDRSGIPNVYAIDIDEEHLYQVTNVVTGAVKPTVHPSNERMAFLQYSENGWDLRMIDIDPDNFLDRGKLPRNIRFGTPIRDVVGHVDVSLGEEDEREDDDGAADAWDLADFKEVQRSRQLKGIAFDPFVPDEHQPQDPPSDSIDSFDNADLEDLFGEEEDFPFTITPHRYNPFPMLLPRYIAPYVQNTLFPAGPTFDNIKVYPFGLQASLSTSASDALRHFLWSASMNYRTDAEYLGGGAALTLNRFIPVYAIGANTRAGFAGYYTYFDEDNLFDENGALVLEDSDPAKWRSIYWEKRSQVWAQVSYPYKLRTTVFAQYSLTVRRELYDIPNRAYVPDIPARRTEGAISGGYRYSWSQQTPYAISLEDGRIFSLISSVKHPWLGTRVWDDNGNPQPLSQLQFTSEIREYVVNPLLDNHVLAMRAGSGITFGGTEFLGNYQLGGNSGDSAFTVTPDQFRLLRGYPFAYDVGDMYWVGNLEYRFPLWHIQRGIGTLPGYARNISAAVFLDSGNAFNSPAASGQAATAGQFADAAFGDPLFGVGAEVSFRAMVLWGLGLSGRLGYAIGLTEGGLGFDDPARPLYFRFGGSF